jgi:hypothetical protein
VTHPWVVVDVGEAALTLRFRGEIPHVDEALLAFSIMCPKQVESEEKRVIHYARTLQVLTCISSTA